MWFDKLDFRDPLQLTKGVYGLLGQVLFPGQCEHLAVGALWGMRAQKAGNWRLPTDKKPEFGGRIQVPLFNGEMALSYHHRNADFTDIYLLVPGINSPFFKPGLPWTGWEMGYWARDLVRVRFKA